MSVDLLERRVVSLEKKMLRVGERNRKVESEKAWENSICRRFLLLLLTYLVTSLVFWIINIPTPWLHAWIPTTAYFLSTLTLPFVRRRWLRQYLKKKPPRLRSASGGYPGK